MSPEICFRPLRANIRTGSGYSPVPMNDDELDDLILGRLRQRRGQDATRATGDRTLSAADLAAFFNEPESHIQDRLRALAEQGRVKESAAVPDRWMIVLTSDPPDDDTDS
jgi:hypothetical protein